MCTEIAFTIITFFFSYGCECTFVLYWKKQKEKEKDDVVAGSKDHMCNELKSVLLVRDAKPFTMGSVRLATKLGLTRKTNPIKMGPIDKI